MNRLLLTLALVVSCFSTAFAGGVNKAENDAAIKAGHQALQTKTAQLETSLKTSNAQAIQTASDNVLILMRKAMIQGSARVRSEATDKQQAANKVFLQMERLAHEYSQLAPNAATNGNQLLVKAKAFLQLY